MTEPAVDTRQLARAIQDSIPDPHPEDLRAILEEHGAWNGSEAQARWEALAAKQNGASPDEAAGEAISWNDPAAIRELGAGLAKLPAADREARLKDLRTVSITLAADDNVGGEAQSEGVRIVGEAMGEARSTWSAEGDARVAIPGTGRLLFRGVPVLGFGERGDGKSTVALTLGLSAVMAGERVLYLDRENEPGLTKSRIEAAIAARDDFDEATLRAGFDGRHYPTLRLKWGDDFAAWVESEGYTLVILDSVREMMQQLDLSQDSADDWSKLHALTGLALAQRGIGTLYLDNVGLKEKHRPRHSSAKLDAVHQGYRISAPAAFSPVTTGLIKIVCVRSRFGDHDLTWSMQVGGGEWEAPRPDTKIAALLVQLPADGWVPANDLADKLGVNRKNVREHYVAPAKEAGAVDVKHGDVETEAGRREALLVRRRDEFRTRLSLADEGI